jgi:predicted ATPase
MESERQVQTWRDSLLDALGNNGSVITNVIPEVEHIIERQKPVEDLLPTERQNRFNSIFINFISVFAKKAHPLVCFLDDLQWADTASFGLIELLLSNKDLKYFFLIGAYRDNEVNESHPLIISRNKINERGIHITDIFLGPLDIEHITELINDTISCSDIQAIQLAEHVAKKTGGNPFFVKQFLYTLHQEKWISHSYKSGWKWDIEKIEHANFTDNVVELMAGNLKKLDKNTQSVVSLAACLGNRFDLKTLSIINNKSIHSTAKTLWKPVKIGLILPLDASYRTVHLSDDRGVEFLSGQKAPDVSYQFLHDRVQQAAYSLIDDKDKNRIHYQIGRLILSGTSKDALDEKLFDILNHLNYGNDLISDENEKSEIAHLNLKAGLKAKSSTAFKQALKYFNSGLHLLGDDSWEKNYELTRNLNMQAGECEYINGNFSKAEDIYDLVMTRATSDVDMADVYNIRIVLYTNQSKYQDVLKIGAEVLNKFDIPLTYPPDYQYLREEIKTAERNIKKMNPSELVNLPDCQSPEIISLSRILIVECLPRLKNSKSIYKTRQQRYFVVRLCHICGN